jgi:hypothetical protein
MENHDGIKFTKTKRLHVLKLNLDEALNQGNPRNIILNGHLFIESKCDSILLEYFLPQDEMSSNDLRRHNFQQFLKFIEMNYFTKIKLLKKSLVFIDTNKEPNIVGPLIKKEVYISLKAIGAIRNAFHHNLTYHDVFECFKDGGDKFIFVNNKGKALNKYDTIEDLVKDFVIETKVVYSKLEELRK